MPKFTVRVCYRTVHTEWAEEVIEASNEDAACDKLRDMIDDGDIDPDWGKEEIVDGDYLFRAIPTDREG